MPATQFSVSNIPLTLFFGLEIGRTAYLPKGFKTGAGVEYPVHSSGRVETIDKDPHGNVFVNLKMPNDKIIRVPAGLRRRNQKDTTSGIISPHQAQPKDALTALSVQAQG